MGNSPQPQPGRPTSGAVRLLTRVVGPVVARLFRPTLEGVHHLPSNGPYLLVSNHNAGLGIAELASFAALWSERFGNERPIAAFAHPIGFKVWPMTLVNRAVGSIPSTYEAAYAALAAGVPILVFPGGDHETFRPVWQANQVDFGGRKGFLRIAARTGVPVVPMGISGSHYTAPILLRSKPLAWLLVVPRLLGIKRWAVSVLSLVGVAVIAALPVDVWVRFAMGWAWVCSPFVFTPWVPWRIRMAIGAPRSAERLFGPEPDDARFAQALVEVEAAIAELVVGR